MVSRPPYILEGQAEEECPMPIAAQGIIPTAGINRRTFLYTTTLRRHAYRDHVGGKPFRAGIG
jgi:hypothetical protein